MPTITSAPLPGPHEQILAITLGFWQSRALAVAAELELAEVLAALLVDGALARGDVRGVGVAGHVLLERVSKNARSP